MIVPEILPSGTGFFRFLLVRRRISASRLGGSEGVSIVEPTEVPDRCSDASKLEEIGSRTVGHTVEYGTRHAIWTFSIGTAVRDAG